MVELVKNKVSGRFFVLLDDSSDTELLVITPEGKVKLIKRHLFDAHSLVESMDAIPNDRLTEIQVETYAEYMDR